jgi:hypothetical protein
LRIKENFHDGFEYYPSELQIRVEKVFRYVSLLTEMKELIADIKNEAVYLQSTFVSEKEQKEGEDAVRFFDARMQATVYYTLKNMEAYSQYGWKQLVDEEVDSK